MHILVPIDGSDASIRALRMGARMVTGAGDELTVVHITDEETDATDAILARAAEVLDELGVDAEPTISTDLDLEFRPGNRVGEDVLALVEVGDVDHVIMGHHGAGALERAILGSATRTVVEAGRVPVTIVP
jgi:nucleotide-binding universal stress UspA family protein